jgi:hypothetical protein
MPAHGKAGILIDMRPGRNLPARPSAAAPYPPCYSGERLERRVGQAARRYTAMDHNVSAAATYIST